MSIPSSSDPAATTSLEIFSSSDSGRQRPPVKRPTAEDWAAARAELKAKRAAQAAVPASKRRSLLWNPPSTEFTAAWSEVKLMCPVVAGDPPYQWLDYPNYGQSIAENWVCDGHPTGQVCRQTGDV